MDHVDDSDGEMGGILGRLGDLHLAACEVARPDPVLLAGRLFAWELGGQWDVFTGAVLTYADVLGETGLAEYRRRAEVEWATVPPLGSGSAAARPREPGAGSSRANRRHRTVDRRWCTGVGKHPGELNRTGALDGARRHPDTWPRRGVVLRS